MKPALRPFLALLSTCVLLLSTLSACEEDPGPTPDAGSQFPTEDSGTPDSGMPDSRMLDSGTPDASTEEPWDGGYTVLEERGDWIDRGRYAPCAFDSVTDSANLRCDDVARYDVSQCDPEALARLEPHGLYLADLRGEGRLSDGGTRLFPGVTSFLLRSDGGPDTLSDEPLVSRNTDGGNFIVVGSRTSPFTGVTTVTALVGCQVPSAGIVTGCYARCNNGRFNRAGTFEAHRMPSQRGEAESSGGLRLISESPVALGEPVDVYVAKGHAYVVSINRAGRNGGLTVFDVSDRAHPLFKASISLPGDSSWNGVWTSPTPRSRSTCATWPPGSPACTPCSWTGTGSTACLPVG